ncbi:MAG: saccharopine dehydrogenase NADP-binding domain-containing protein [Alphaproteobacteria bacterium]
MRRVLVLGAGKIGYAIAALLSKTGTWEVTVADKDEKALQPLSDLGVSLKPVEVEDLQALKTIAAGHWAILSALPFSFTPIVARTAKEVGAHYLDLTEDVESTRQVKALAEGAKTAFIPQCGLAPGFISVVGYDLARKFEKLDSLHMRVGALPEFPTGSLKYNLTWSTDGLINEYCNPCEAIVDQELREVLALEGVEAFAMDGIDYEAFNTSGGLGTLCETLGGKIRNLDYKTVRYPGHRDLMYFLVRDLRLSERRGILKDILETAVPITLQDVVLIFVTARGWRGGRFEQESWVRKVYAANENGEVWSAIQRTTAGGACAMLDLLHHGHLPQQGFVRQEQASLEQYLSSPFAHCYR